MDLENRGQTAVRSSVPRINLEAVLQHLPLIKLLDASQLSNSKIFLLNKLKKKSTSEIFSTHCGKKVGLDVRGRVRGSINVRF